MLVWLAPSVISWRNLIDRLDFFLSIASERKLYPFTSVIIPKYLGRFLL